MGEKITERDLATGTVQSRLEKLVEVKFSRPTVRESRSCSEVFMRFQCSKFTVPDSISDLPA